MLTRIAVAMTFVAVMFVFTPPVFAAPLTQDTIPDFTLNAQSTLTVTIVLTDGESIVVPVEVEFVAENQDGTVDVAVDATVDAVVEEQPDLEIIVESSAASTATLEISTDTPITATTTPTATATTTPTEEAGDATSYTANRQSNVRSGPGTDFEIVRTIEQGDEVMVVGQNEDGTWLELDDGNWMAAFLIDPTEAGTDTDASVTGTAPVTTTVAPGAVGNQAALAVYLLENEAINTYMSNSLATLEELLQDPQPASAQWRLQVAAQVAVISGASEELLALAPVSGYEELYDQVVAMATACSEATDEVNLGITNVSPTDLRAAAESIQTCRTQVTELAGTLQTVQ